MIAKDIPDGSWFMTREKKWFKKSHNEPETNAVIATQIGNPRIFTIDPNEKVQLRQ